MEPKDWFGLVGAPFMIAGLVILFSIDLKANPFAFPGALFLVAIGLMCFALAWISHRRQVRERKELNEQSYPNLAWFLVNEGQPRCLLRIINRGIALRLTPTISISGSTLHQRSGVEACWADGGTSPRELFKHQHLDILIAYTGLDQPDGEGPGMPTSVNWYWYVPFIEHGKREASRGLKPSFPGKPWLDPLTRQDVALKVFSEPADPTSAYATIDCALTLIGCDQVQIRYGVIWGPQPDTALKDFIRAARTMLYRFDELSLMGGPLPEDNYTHFALLVNDAGAACDRLRWTLPEKGQLLLLVSRFVGANEANLDSLSDAAHELRDWLTKAEVS